MGRKCSHCGFMGHNSRTCASIRRRDASFGGGGGGRVKLFGVQLEAAYPCGVASRLPLKKSLSMDYLLPSVCVLTSSSLPSSSTNSSLSLRSACDVGDRLLRDESPNKAANSPSNDGYASDGFLGRAQERKKGLPWTEEEHRTFLVGLETLGKGDWRGISKKFVGTRTPTQVASHAQKYFLRQKSLLPRRNKRRPSLFDVGMERCRAHHHGQIPKPSESFTPICLFSPQFGSTGRDSRARMVLLASPRTCSFRDREIPSSNLANHASSVSGRPASNPNLELTLASPNHQLDQASSIRVT